MALLLWFGAMVFLVVMHKAFPHFRPLDLHEPPSDTVLQWKGDRPESAEARAALAAWEAGSAYYGAFAVGPEQRLGWVSDYNVPQMAEETALAICGEGCQVVAVLAPLVPPDPDMVTLSHRAQKWLAELRSHPLSRAFAIAPSGETGWAYDYHLQVDAEERALFECEKQLTERNPDWPHSACTLIDSKGIHTDDLLPPRPNRSLF